MGFIRSLENALLEGLHDTSIAQNLPWQLSTMHGNGRVIADRTIQREIAFRPVDGDLTDMRPLQTPHHLEYTDCAATEAEQHVRGGLNLLRVPEEVVQLRAGDMGDLAAG